MIQTILRTTAAIGLAVGGQLVPTPAAAAPAALSTCTQLDLAGSKLSLPITSPAKPSSDGSVFPILFVHGFNDTAKTWTRPAAVTWFDTPNISDPKSFIDWIGNIPGALPVVFDYGGHSLEWVNNAAIGPALAKVVDCLARAAGEKVDIVAHSMGGLAARHVLGDPKRAAQVSLVVTLGTPNLGSFWPAVLTKGARDAPAVNRWIQLVHHLHRHP